MKQQEKQFGSTRSGEAGEGRNVHHRIFHRVSTAPQKTAPEGAVLIREKANQKRMRMPAASVVPDVRPVNLSFTYTP